MFTISTAAVATAVAAVAVASPAVAVAATMHGTTLTASPTSSSAASHAKAQLVLEQKTTSSGVTRATSDFAVRERRSGTNRWSAWSASTAKAHKAAGHYTISLAVPSSLKVGAREQYQVRFTGSTGRDLAAATSNTVTVTKVAVKTKG